MSSVWKFVTSILDTEIFDFVKNCDLQVVLNEPTYIAPTWFLFLLRIHTKSKFFSSHTRDEKVIFFSTNVNAKICSTFFKYFQPTLSYLNYYTIIILLLKNIFYIFIYELYFKRKLIIKSMKILQTTKNIKASRSFESVPNKNELCAA